MALCSQSHRLQFHLVKAPFLRQQNRGFVSLPPFWVLNKMLPGWLVRNDCITVLWLVPWGGLLADVGANYVSLVISLSLSSLILQCHGKQPWGGGAGITPVTSYLMQSVCIRVPFSFPLLLILELFPAKANEMKPIPMTLFALSWAQNLHWIWWSFWVGGILCYFHRRSLPAVNKARGTCSIHAGRERNSLTPSWVSGGKNQNSWALQPPPQHFIVLVKHIMSWSCLLKESPSLAEGLICGSWSS